jgi:hypothetical protein
MTVWRTLLRLSTDYHNTGDVQVIDATGFDRRSVSRHYANRILVLALASIPPDSEGFQPRIYSRQLCVRERI